MHGNNLIKNGLVIGIIALFVGASIVPSITGDYDISNISNDNIQKNNQSHIYPNPPEKSDNVIPIITGDYNVSNISNDNVQKINHSHMYPPENSVVCGYVTDELTSNPIEDAHVHLEWRDEQGHDDWNSTHTDSSGFYSMNIAAGKFDLYFSADGYFSESTGYYNYNIEEHETLWINMYLYLKPHENSVVCGYITDSTTGDPIENSDIQLRWEGEQGHHYYNYTESDDLGYYTINTAAGEIRLNADADGYFQQYTEYIDIEEYEVEWINISIDPRPVENSIVCGYVIDSITDEPIENSYIGLSWYDDNDNYNWNSTYTNSDGFYNMNVAEGEIKLSIFAEEYIGDSTNWIIIEENEKLWLNFTLEKDVTLPSISNLTVPNFVGVNHPGNISADISDNNLLHVCMMVFDEYNITDQDFIVWYYLNDTGMNGTYAIRDYPGTYANLKQNINSSPATVIDLSKSTETGKIYILADFKKNHTSSWIGSVLLEFNLSNGILTNIAIPTTSQNGTLELDYITDMVEPGVSAVAPISLYFNGNSVLGSNYTLYSVGNHSNPCLNWSLLGDGKYNVLVEAVDKAYNQRSILFDLTVNHKPIADFMYAPPLQAPTDIVKILKGFTSRQLFMEFSDQI